MFYPRWKLWWEANRGVPRIQWILNGFREGGLHVTDPPDEKFGLELVDALMDKREYYAINAQRLLVIVGTRERGALLKIAAASDQKRLRLGALKVLEQIDPSDQSEVIQS